MGDHPKGVCGERVICPLLSRGCVKYQIYVISIQGSSFPLPPAHGHGRSGCGWRIREVFQESFWLDTLLRPGCVFSCGAVGTSAQFSRPGTRLWPTGPAVERLARRWWLLSAPRKPAIPRRRCSLLRDAVLNIHASEASLVIPFSPLEKGPNGP